jgi:DNA replication protein DnaC
MGKRKRELTEVDLNRLNIGRRYWSAELDRIPEAAQHKEFVSRYCSKIHAVRKRGVGLLLWGDNSRGKTYSAAIILKTAVRYGFSGYCVLADQLKQAVIEQHTFEQSAVGEKKTVEQRAREVDFLVLEDLGKEYRAASGFSETQFENLIRYRTRNLMPTIITTNLSLAEFRDRYAKSSFEIAKECLYPFQVKGTGKSFRSAIASKIERDLK